MVKGSIGLVEEFLLKQMLPFSLVLLPSNDFAILSFEVGVGVGVGRVVGGAAVSPSSHSSVS